MDKPFASLSYSLQLTGDALLDKITSYLPEEDVLIAANLDVVLFNDYGKLQIGVDISEIVDCLPDIPPEGITCKSGMWIVPWRYYEKEIGNC